MELAGKVAIVTGASSGIGLVTAKLLSNKGAKVALVARSKEKLQEISKTLPNSAVFQTDMSKEEEVRKMVKDVFNFFKRIDILVNNAGVGYDASIKDIDIKKFRYVFDLDLTGPTVAMQEVIPIMKKQKEGAIVNISSGTALMILPNMGAYSSLKKALAQISLTANEELSKDNIKVSVVYPYITETDFEKNTLKDGKVERWDEDLKRIPPGDAPGFVAEKILEAIETGKTEITAHDWMGKR